MLRILLDTHVVVRWLIEPKKLSSDQVRVLNDADRHAEPLALSAITLIEIAVLIGARRIDANPEEIFGRLSESPGVQILPVTIPIATEIWALGEALRDPMDRTIVATARIHRLRLLTSDQRIIASKLISVVE
jgi:PIN domain nuclease of toxin-antitoxin system